MELEAALARLNDQLPLKARQERLPPALQSMHRQVLMSLVTRGRPPTLDELSHGSSKPDVLTGLRRLGQDDLVVLDSDSGMPLGAYPVTSETTPHRIDVNGHGIFAMCALDAVSVAPLFGAEVRIDSCCHVSHTPIRIRMHGSNILLQEPERELMIGIRWQMPTAVAAHSMCLQMVFLHNREIALDWQAGDTYAVSLFPLSTAIDFGKAFFLPLMIG